MPLVGTSTIIRLVNRVAGWRAALTHCLLLAMLTLILAATAIALPAPPRVVQGAASATILRAYSFGLDASSTAKENVHITRQETSDGGVTIVLD
jgi:hypothetical protein